MASTNNDALISGVSGALGGMASMAVTYPLGAISMRAAVNRTQSVKEDKLSDSSLFEVIRKIVDDEGVAGLYQGLESALFGIAITNGTYYLCFEKVRSYILGRGVQRGLTVAESMLAGLLAGAATTIISNPIWVINTRQTVRSNKDQTLEERLSHKKSNSKPGFLETGTSLVQSEGVTALWAGVGPALLLVVNPIIQYTVAEQLKNMILSRRAVGRISQPLSDLENLFVGAFGKLNATILTYPYLLVKSRLQAGANKEAGGKQSKTFWSELYQIWKKGGLKSLYAGMQPKIIQSISTAAFLFVFQARIFALVKRLLEINQKRKALH